MPRNDGRLSLRINSRLKERIESYAERHGTTLSALTTKFYQDLLKYEEQFVQRRAEKKFFDG